MAEKRRNFGTGTCPECNKEDVRLTAEGKIRSHGKRSDPCKGTGAVPVEDQDGAAGDSTPEQRDEWDAFREYESTDALKELGEIPGHGTVMWAQDMVLDTRQPTPDQAPEYARALLVLKAGNLDKLTPATRAALQRSRPEQYPHDPTIADNPAPGPETDLRPTATEYREASQVVDGGHGEYPEDLYDESMATVERATRHGVRPDAGNPGPNPWREPLPTMPVYPDPGPPMEYGPSVSEFSDPGPAYKQWGTPDQMAHANALAGYTTPEYPTSQGSIEFTHSEPPTVAVGVPSGYTPDGTPTATFKPQLRPDPRPETGNMALVFRGGREPAAPVPSASPDTRFTAAPPAPSEHAAHPDAPVHSLRPGPQDGIDFDQWGRYKIPDPVTGEMRGRQRVTTFIKGLGDQYGLTKWQQRVLLSAAAHYPNSPQMAQARELAPAKDGGGFDVKTNAGALDKLADALKTAGGDKLAADHGTKVHRYTELYDLGRLDLASVPAPFRADVEAYVRKIQATGLVPVPDMLERTTILRSLEVAGTFDKIFQLPNGEYVIGDVKTGQSMEYAALDIRQQLACYAHGVNENGIWEWDNDIPERGRWLPAPKVRTDFAIVVHIPAGSGTCTLRRVDLVHGWADCALSMQIRDARKTRKDLPLLITDGPEFQPAAPGPQADDPASVDAPASRPPAGWAGEHGPEPVFPTPLAVQPPSLPDLQPDLGTLRGYARAAMWQAFQEGRGGQAAVWETATATFPAGDPVLLELVTIGRGEPPF